MRVSSPLCRFVVAQCNHLLRNEDWVEARNILGMDPLPEWEGGERSYIQDFVQLKVRT